MKVIIPFGSKDADNFKLLVQAIVALGTVKQDLIIVAVPSTAQLAVEGQEELLKVCNNVEVLETGMEFNDGWPMGPNRIFHWTAETLYTQGHNQAWLWLEPDSCPMKSNWASILELAYQESGTPYMGFVRQTRLIDTQGRIYFKPNDKMMVGPSIYPANMVMDADMAPLFNNLKISAKNAHPKLPWDLLLRWKFFKRGVTETNLIFDKWHTANYRREGGVLTCDPAANPPVGSSSGGVIPSDAVVVHGCKDGSLHRLIIEENTAKVKAPPVVKAPAIVAPKPKAEKPKPKAKPAVSEEAIVKALDELFAMAANGRRFRIGEVASRSGQPVSAVKETLNKLGYPILGAGWVSLTKEPI